jgi:hypothetical protein
MTSKKWNSLMLHDFALLLCPATEMTRSTVRGVTQVTPRSETPVSALGSQPGLPDDIYVQTKKSNFGTFWRAWKWKILFFLWQFV